jgi:ribulose-phosphate 3-epimerase
MKELLRPGMGLEVDGGVGPATIERCRAAGANLMVAGSAIYDQPSPAEAWKALTTLAGA